MASLQSYVFERLLQDDCRVLRRFEGESSLRTYLAVVIARLYLDYCDKLWGRWRPSALARRLGREAVLLDTAMNRDGVPRIEAVRSVANRDDVVHSERELELIADQLPRRAQRREVGLDASGTVTSSIAADAALTEAESVARRNDAFGQLERALESLDKESRSAIRLIYWEGMTVAAAARVLGIPQKPLYRTLRRQLTNLRESLEQVGLTSAGVVELIEGTAAQASDPIHIVSGEPRTAARSEWRS